MKLLADKGATVNTKDKNGRSALVQAIVHAKKEAVLQLCELGAELPQRAVLPAGVSEEILNMIDAERERRYNAIDPEERGRMEEEVEKIKK